jgi:hypothetical protein
MSVDQKGQKKKKKKDFILDVSCSCVRPSVSSCAFSRTKLPIRILSAFPKSFNTLASLDLLNDSSHSVTP